MDISILNESSSIKYYSYHFKLDGKYQEGPLNNEERLLGEFDEEVFHWIYKDESSVITQEGWDVLVDNGDIERVYAKRLTSGQIITGTSIIKRLIDM
jgi:hypothetical protein